MEIYKKFIIIIIIMLLCFFGSRVFADDMTTTQVNADLTYYVKKDTDFLKTAFFKNNIKNIYDFAKLLRDSGLSSSGGGWGGWGGCVSRRGGARRLQEGDGLNITGRWYTVLHADVQMGILCDVVLKEGEPDGIEN